MFKKISLAQLLLVAVAMLLFTASSKADTVTFTGNTTGGATFNRPLVGTPPTALSGVGTAVRYTVTQLSVSLGGAYTFSSVPNTVGYDNFTILYANSFNPASPLTNALIANDDVGGIGVSSGFTFSLTAGVNYFFVNTGFANDDFGAFTSTITGPGVITIGGQPGAIPEPATMILLGTGLAGVVAKVRRRRQSDE